MAASLNGKVIAHLEARMQSEMSSLIERHGGVAVAAPVLQEIYLKDDPQAQQLVRDICAGKISAVALQTGVGTLALIETAEAMGQKEEFIRCLDQLMIIARSPKPGRALRQHKIHIDVMPPEPFTSEDLVAALQDVNLQGQTVAVQHYGGPNNYLVRSLQEKGALVREVTLYTWGLPDDTSPVISLIDQLAQDRIDAVAFTSQPQVGNLLTIAASVGKVEALLERLNSPRVVVASVGPVSSRRLRERGIKVDLEPEHPHMGNLVVELAQRFYSGVAASQGR